LPTQSAGFDAKNRLYLFALTVPGFGRAAGRIREVVLDVIEGKFPVSTEDDRKIFWPEGADKSELPPFRMGSLEDRDHADIPLAELATLARRFLDTGAKVDEVPALIARELGLERLREAARERFEKAAGLGQRSSSTPLQ
jgi:hypothetical protein